MAESKDAVLPHSGPGGESGSGAGAGHTLSAGERAEYERLRRHAGVRHRRLRKVGAAVLLVVPLLLAPLAVVAARVHAAYLYGPGRVARRVRALARRGTTAAGRALRGAGVSTGRTGRRLAAHPRWTSGIVLGAGALALLLWNRPTVGGAVLVAVLVLVLVLVVVVVVLAVVAVLAAAADPPDESGLTRPG
ncbi:hypothetical protein [Streptomyces sp. NBC_01314]|uniref:hypothetical protein n=1 Tax=Streptomyces sp. NBC_01314 TaxID=2903821 RepID=UPI003090B2FD|nr:hypothetical protein OG622_43495 [Streptomyces sp. NBC_01314]